MDEARRPGILRAAVFVSRCGHLAKSPVHPPIHHPPLHHPPMADLEEAIRIAVEAHRGQKDRAGAPYILHPLRMMLRVQTDAERMAAVLHDVVEDTDWTLDALREHGFPDEVVTAVDHLTRREGESYEEFVTRAA